MPGLRLGVLSYLLLAKGSELMLTGWDSGVESGDRTSIRYSLLCVLTTLVAEGGCQAPPLTYLSVPLT